MLLLGVLAAVGAGWWQQRANQQALTAETLRLAERAVNNAQTQIERTELGLRGARGYLMGAGLDHVTRQGFLGYFGSRDLAREFPGVLGLGFIRRVAPADEARYVAAVRQQGWPGFAVRTLTPHDGERMVIQAVEPAAPNNPAIGLDIGSETQRRRAANTALTSDRAVLTGPVRLVQSQPGSAMGLLMVLRLPEQLAGARYGVSGAPGWVYSPVQLDALLASADLLSDRISLQLDDVTDGQAAPLSFQLHQAGDAGAQAGAPGLQLQRDVLSRQWRFTVRPRPALVRALNLRSPASLAAATGLAGSLLAALGWLWLRLRQRTADALAEHTRLSTMLDHASDAVIGLDLQGRVTLWNRAASELFGVQAQHALGRPLSQLALASAFAAEDQVLFANALQGRPTKPFETLRRHRDGHEVDVELSAGPMFNRHGRVVGVVKVLRPIAERLVLLRELQTARQGLEREVAVRTAQLARTGRMANVGGWELDLDTGVLNLSDQALRLYGFAPGTRPTVAECIAHYAPEAQATFREALQLAMRTGQGWDLELPFVRADGQHLWLRVLGEAEMAQGQPVRLTGALQDITAMRAATDAVRQAQALLISALDLAGAGLAIYDTDDQLVFCNQRLQAMFPQVIATLAHGQTLAAFVRGVAQHYPVAEAVEDAQAWVQARLATRRTGGDWLRALQDGRRIRVVERVLPDGQLVSLHMDVTELAQARDQAEAASRAKSDFLSNTSHEIRTPLNAILGLAYMLERAALAGPQRQMVQQIRQAGQSLLALLNDVLDLAKIEAGQLELEVRRFDLRRLLREAHDLHAPGAQAKGLRLALDLAPAVPEHVRGDMTRLRQVLNNLLGNALKFTAAGEVTLRVRPGAAPPQLCFEVSDTGIGIEPEVQDKLFQPFTQADAATTRRFGGTGLGLSIVARIVGQMGGTVALASQPGAGARFTVTLPLPEASAADGPEDSPSAEPLRLLVAEDDANQRIALARTARALGWTTETVDGGRAMVDAVIQAHQQGLAFDAVVVDWQMPDLDGLSALAQLHTRLPEAAVPAAVVVSAHELGLLRAAPHANLAASLLVKPVNGSTLFNAVNQAVARRAGGGQRLLEATRVDQPDTQWLPGVRILLVDDSALNLAVARRMLEMEGALVTTCTDGLQALALLAATPQGFDSVLLDVQMPGLDGNQTARRLRRNPALVQLPVVALSAGVLASERERALASGMSDFLPKPLDPQRLIRCLRRHVERYRQTPVPVRPRAGAAASEATTLAPAAAPAAPDLDGFELAQVPNALRQDGPLYLSMLGRLLREFARVGDDPPEQRLARLHKLRGSAQVVGAAAIAAQAGALESRLRANPAHDAGPGLQALQRQMAALAASLQPRLDAEAARQAARQAASQARREGQPGGSQLRATDRDRLADLMTRQSVEALSLFEQLADALRSALPADQHAAMAEAVQEFNFAHALALLRSARTADTADAPGTAGEAGSGTTAG